MFVQQLRDGELPGSMLQLRIWVSVHAMQEPHVAVQRSFKPIGERHMSDFFDCTSWRIVGSDPNCARGFPMNCDSCQHRESRNGNFMHPPVYYVPAVHPALQSQESSAGPRRNRVVSSEAPCCQDKVQEADSKIRGLGDVVAIAAKTIGIKQTPGCGCAEKQEALNKMFPFGKARIE